MLPCAVKTITDESSKNIVINHTDKIINERSTTGFRLIESRIPHNMPASRYTMDI